MVNGLIARERLSAAELDAVRRLVTRDEAHGGQGIKLNWGMMGRREPGQANDFCWYDDDRLVGYAPLDSFGPSGEVTVLVHPDFRRRGIGRVLATAAYSEAQRRDCTELLLVNVRASTTGRGFAEALGLPLGSSEYHLEFAGSAPPTVPANTLEIRQARAGDLAFLTQIAILSFGITEDEARQMGENDLAGGAARSFLIERDGIPLGRLGTIKEESETYLRSFGVLPEERGRGIGRILLAGTIARLWSEGERQFSLDVVTDNRHALELYRSCGFTEALAYDYYSWPLDRPAR
ncbi:MAG TPA: GNAT family N-acetyltransferase [Thermomicrobiales bacterium]|jgi:ribosomal protein S18 acetylase RimI-like enzyme